MIFRSGTANVLLWRGVPDRPRARGPSYSQLFAASTTMFYLMKDQTAFQTRLHSFDPNVFPAVATNEHPVGWTGRIFPTSFSVSATTISVGYLKVPLLGASTPDGRNTAITVDRVPSPGVTHWSFGSSAALGAGAMAPTVTGALQTVPSTPRLCQATQSAPVEQASRFPSRRTTTIGWSAVARRGLVPMVEAGVANLDDTHLYVGSAPGLIYGGCHGPDERAVFDELCQIVDEAIVLYEEDGKPLPPATAGH